MKKLARFLLLFFVTSCLIAEDISVNVLYTNGKQDILTYDRGIRFLSFANSDTLRIKQISNLENFDQLETLEFIMIRDIEDYSFLGNIHSLKTLYMATCTLRDLSFLASLINLESFYIRSYIHKSSVKAVTENKIDLGNLSNLKIVAFDCTPYIGAPPFINIRTKPFLDFKNSQITDMTAEDIKLFSQYSMIDFRFTPIEKQVALRGKIPSVKFIMKGDTLPATVHLEY